MKMIEVNCVKSVALKDLKVIRDTNKAKVMNVYFNGTLLRTAFHFQSSLLARIQINCK